MQLSENTVNILKNFAGINSNLVFKPGQSLSTISEAKTIMAKASIAENFDHEFGVYDLNEFLSVMNLVDAPVLTFEDKSVLVSNTAGGVKRPNSTKVRYYYSELDILTQPSKDINMPKCEVSFDLSSDDLDRIKKAAAVLGHTELMFSCESGASPRDSGEIVAKVFDERDATANTFNITLDATSTETFDFVFSISNLKMLHGDYKVSISSRLISNWKNKDIDLEYFIALEPDSKYNA